MSYLIDTNIVSEVRKGERCAPGVAAWYASIDDADIFLSALVLGEIRKGIERVKIDDPKRAKALQSWLATLATSYADHILPIDLVVAEEWGRMSVKRPVPTIDSLLAATAKVHGLMLVTRNIADVADLGVAVLNPFTIR